MKLRKRNYDLFIYFKTEQKLYTKLIILTKMLPSKHLDP